MGNTVTSQNQSNTEYYNLIKQECKDHSKNRSKLKEILKREWSSICIKQSEQKILVYYFTPINYIIDMLDIEELTKEYTQFLTKWNCNNLEISDFYVFNEFINNINL